MTVPDNVLEVNDLSIRLGKTDVLRHVSFDVPRGTSLALVGPNGSGKTVLFRALIGAIPFEGSIRWAPGVRIGYVPQKLDIDRDVPITGLDFLRAHPGLGRTSHVTVAEALELVALSQATSEQPIGEMSGGQFQRLLVAFALVGSPNVFLLDEPTAGVDEPGEERLNDLVHRLQHEQGLTILLISHELTIVSRYATNVLCLSRQQTWFGPPKKTLTQDLLQEMYGTPTALHFHDR